MKLRRILWTALIWTLLSADETNAVSPFFIQEYGAIAAESGILMYPEIEARHGHAMHGYAMHRIKIENRSMNKTYRITLRLPDGRARRKLAQNRLHSISKTIEIAPSTIECVTLFQPALPLHGIQCAVYINGKRQQKAIPLAWSLSAHGATPTSSPTAVMTGPLSGSSALFIPKVLKTASDYRGIVRRKASEYLSNAGIGAGKLTPLPKFINAGHFDIRFRRAVKVNNHFDPSWLNYSPLEGVVYDDFYVKDAKPDTLLALRRYVECGGTLTLIIYHGFDRYGGRELPDSLARFDRRLKNRRVFENTYERFDMGFGVFHLVAQDSETGQIPDSAVAIPETWYEAEAAWHQLHTAYGANQVLPMTEPIDSRASYQRFFFLMLILAVLIGPVHLYLLKRTKRREWVYWTTPALAVLACGALVLYASVTIGWSRQTRVVSLTHLDQGAGRAATIGWAAYYSPLTSSAELRFDENTELTPLAFGDRLVGSIDWTDGQRLTGGWLPARVPRHFKLRKNEDRPERIDLKRDGGDIMIVNRLGAPRQDVLVCRPWRQGLSSVRRSKRRGSRFNRNKRR